MKKAEKTTTDPDTLPEYDFRDGVRGKYTERCAQGTNVILLAPNVVELFPNSGALDNALRALVAIARETVKPAEN